MSAVGEDDLICDFAETYHVLDWRGLPVMLAATLAAGLPDSSRIKCRMAGLKQPLETLLLAKITDLLNLWLWAHTQDGEAGRNQPASIVQAMTRREPERKHKVFRNGADFIDAYRKFIGE